MDTSRALLFKYVEPARARQLLHEAGLLATRRGEGQRAVDCFRLAGSWYAVVHELEQRLAANLSHLSHGQRQDDARQGEGTVKQSSASQADRFKWWAVGRDFYATYLDPGSAAAHQSHALGDDDSCFDHDAQVGGGVSVRDAVARHAPPMGRSGPLLLDAFDRVCRLYDFTDKARAGQFTEALAVAHGLQVLPTHQDHVQPALEQMERLLRANPNGSGAAGQLAGAGNQPFLRPDHLQVLLLHTMRCHWLKHEALKSAAAGGGGVSAAAVADNAAQARVLGQFASGIGPEYHSSDTLVQLDEMLSHINY